MAPERRRKLIEVALPLEAINRESAREKSIRHGHPSTLHLWCARSRRAARCCSRISVEIHAEHAEGFPEDKIRIIQENARTLHFDQSTFEDH